MMEIFEIANRPECEMQMPDRAADMDRMDGPFCRVTPFRADETVYRGLHTVSPEQLVRLVTPVVGWLPAALKRAVEKRRSEFLAGRLCARAAVRHFLEDFDGPLAVGAGREPIFPAGLSGSICHAPGIVAAVCQPASMGTIGLDAESFMSADTEENVSSLIATPGEFDLPDWKAMPLTVRATLIFSAKEALFKALYPRVQRMLDFDMSVLRQVDFRRAIMHFSLDDSIGDCASTSGGVDVAFRILPSHVMTLSRLGPSSLVPKGGCRLPQKIMPERTTTADGCE